MNAPGLKHICRNGFAGVKPKADYPLSNGFDEVDTLLVFDNVLIPWENVLFYRHTAAASFIRGTLHRYSAYMFVLRIMHIADLMIGTALFNVRQTGLDKQQAVQEKLAQLACYREGINAHLSAAIALAEKSPGGFLMPNQSLLYTGRVLACSQLPAMMHIARELCGGQICVTPDSPSFLSEDTKAWMEKFYNVNDNWQAEDRRKLLAFARDLLELRLRRPQADLPAVRPVAAVRPSGRRLPQFRLRRIRWASSRRPPACPTRSWSRPKPHHGRDDRAAAC